MTRRTVLLLATSALALIAAGGIALAATFTCTTDPCDGTTDDDVITGTVNAETINGKAGNDEISARDANDTLNGEDGNDTLHGELGDDRLNGGDGPDQLLGEDGVDRINGQAGNDDLNAGLGNDVIFVTTNWGSDTIINGDGSDTIAPVDGATAAAMPNLTVNLVSGTGPEYTDDNGNTINWNDNVIIRKVVTGAGDDVISQLPKKGSAMDGGAGSDTYKGFTSEPFGGDNILDTGGTADVLDLSSRSLASARWATPFRSQTGGNVQWLRIHFYNGAFICEEATCNYLDIGNYFDSTSPDVCASGPGPGAIETIEFIDDPSVDFAQVKSLLGCDTTQPMVDSTSPVGDATGIAPTANVSATFSEAMDASTINGSTFTLTKPDGPDADPNPDPVAGVVNYDWATKTATLDPTADLDHVTTYTATVTTGAEDLAGNRLDQDPNTPGNQPKTWSFTTAAPPPDTTSPKVQSMSPSNGARGVLRTKMVKARFSEDVDGVTVDTFMLGKGKLSNSQLTPATKLASGTIVSYEPTSKTAKLDPYGSGTTTLARCQWYTANVTGGIEDKAGNPAVEKLWSFRTRGC